MYIISLFREAEDGLDIINARSVTPHNYCNVAMIVPSFRTLT